MNRLHINRRALLAGTAAMPFVARQTFAQTPVAEVSGDHYLIAGATTSDDRGWLEDIEVFDSQLRSTGVQAFNNSIVLRVEPTGNPHIIQVHMLDGMVLLETQTASGIEIDWGVDGIDLLYSMPYNSYGFNRNPDWMLFSNLELTRALLLDLQTFEGRDIADHIAPPWAQVVPLLPDIPAEGSIATVWTGDYCYYVDFESPEDAIRLVGEDSDWYTTAASLSEDRAVVSFTAYEPDSDGEVAQVYLMDVASEEKSVIADGTAWTAAYFLPGYPEEFLLSTEAGLERRKIATPEVEGELIAEGGQQNLSLYWLDDANVILYSYAEDDESPRIWQKVDLRTNEATPLSDLDGMKIMWPDLAVTAPEWLMFVNDNPDGGLTPFIGLDVATAEVWTVMDEVYLHHDSPFSATWNGEYYSLASKNRGNTKGAWLFNMKERSVYSFPYGDGQFTERAMVSPDGQTVAVGIVEQPGGAYVSYTCPTSNPEELTELTDRVVWRWV